MRFPQYMMIYSITELLPLAVIITLNRVKTEAFFFIEQPFYDNFTKCCLLTPE